MIVDATAAVILSLFYDLMSRLVKYLYKVPVKKVNKGDMCIRHKIN